MNLFQNNFIKNLRLLPIFTEIIQKRAYNFKNIILINLYICIWKIFIEGNFVYLAFLKFFHPDHYKLDVIQYPV